MSKDLYSELSIPLENPARGGHPTTFHFNDRIYLSAVVSHLKDTREAKSLAIAPLSRKAALKNGVILHAERGALIPNSSQLKAWSSALGIAWEDLWKDTMARLSNDWSPPAPTAY